MEPIFILRHLNEKQNLLLSPHYLSRIVILTNY